MRRGWWRLVDGQSAVETAPEVGLRADAKPACAGWGRAGTEPVVEHPPIMSPGGARLPALGPALVAEGIGTFGLVFAGCGAIMADQVSHGAVSHVGASLVFGLIVAAMISALGHISGAHFNPAVTLGFVVARHFPLKRLAGYWGAQLGGAVAAALALRVLLGQVAQMGATVPSGGVWQSFGFEAILSFGLMLVIMAVATDTRAVGQAAAFAIGATVGLEALFAGPISGASMNPARSLGPALVAGVWTAQWVYVAAPLMGAACGALVYRWLRETSSGERLARAGG